MSKTRILVLFVTHALALAAGFAAGIYFLPILIAPDAPASEAVAEVAETREYVASFSRDREDSDAFHWGEGEVSIGSDAISFMGELSPGPDYKLYLSPEYIETEADFNRLKSSMVQVGDVKTFDRFIVPINDAINPGDYRAVIVWCESFGQYITSGQYR